MTFYIPLGIIGLILAAIFIAQSSRERQRMLEKKLERVQTDVKFDYNRFNTKDERSTTFRKIKDKLHISTDVQLIQIAENSLLLQIRSNLETQEKVGFDIMLAPFSKDLFVEETASGFKFDDGIIVLAMHNDLAPILREIEAYSGEIWKHAPDGSVKLKYTLLETNPAQESVKITGEFLNGSMFYLNFFYKSFRLEFELDPLVLAKKNIYESFDVRDLS